jgi:hypothetical protein
MQKSGGNKGADRWLQSYRLGPSSLFSQQNF